MSWMLIVGGILILVSIGTFIGYQSAKGKLGEIISMQTSKIADLEEMMKATDESLGAGSYSQYAELKGEMECPKPLVSELGKKKCAYYQTVVEREWEEEEWVTDSEGNREKQTNRGRDTMANNTDCVSFFLNDGTGKIKVNPREANLDLIKSKEIFEPAESAVFDNNYLRLGGLSFNIGSSRPNDGRRRTLGYRYREEYFPAEGHLYLLGRVHNAHGSLEVDKPQEKGQRFIVTHKSEDMLIEEGQKQSTMLKYVAIGSGISGVILALLGLVVGK